MGQRHREIRKKVKKVSRLLNIREDEFGELKVKITKAEARRRAIRREVRRYIEKDIVERASQNALEDVQRQEDEAFLQGLNLAVETLRADA